MADARAGSGRPLSAGTLTRKVLAVRAAADDATLAIARDAEEPAAFRLQAVRSAIDALGGVAIPVGESV